MPVKIAYYKWLKSYTMQITTHVLEEPINYTPPHDSTLQDVLQGKFKMLLKIAMFVNYSYG